VAEEDWVNLADRVVLLDFAGNDGWEEWPAAGPAPLAHRQGHTGTAGMIVTPRG
jgi:hypothetical protein